MTDDRNNAANRWRRGAYGAVFGAVGAWCVPAWAAQDATVSGSAPRDPAPMTVLAQAEPVVTLDIPAQPLAAALATFAAETGWQIGYPSEMARDVTSGAVAGRFAPADALSRILAGTGLDYRMTGEGTATLVALPAETGASVRLPPVTVLGSRRLDAPLSNIPASITYVGQAEIDREQRVTNRVEDIVSRTVPGFNPTNNGVRNIRGRTAQVFINGVPVNEQLRASAGSDLNLVQPDQLSAIEVSRGANSAYGFGSSGGIIALSTPRAESEELTLRTVLRESFNPHRVGGSHQASLYQSAAQIVGDFDYHVGGVLAYDGAEFDPSGDLALGFDNSALLNNGKEVIGSIDGSFGYDMGDAGRLRLSTTFQNVDFRERYQLVPGVFRGPYGSLDPQPQGEESFRRSYTVNLNYENADVAGSALRLEVFASDTYNESFRSVGARVVRDEQTNVYHGFRSSLSTPLDGLVPGGAVTYGLDVIENRFFRPVFFTDTGALQSFVSPDVTLESLAVFGQLDVPVGDFVLSGGLRHERYDGEAESGAGVGGIVGGDIRNFDLTLFNAGLVYFVDDSTELYTTFSQGAEISQLGRSARGATTAAEVDTQPAKSNQYEIGIRGDWASLSLALAAFYTESDLLSSLICDGINPCIPLREPREFWGVEAIAAWQIDPVWGVGGVFTWQDGLRVANGDTRRIDNRDLPPVLVTGFVDYSPAPWVTGTLQVNYRGERDPFPGSVAFGEGKIDEEILVNVSAAFDLGRGQLRLGVENLLNTEYTSIPAESGNSGFLWLPEEGRRVFVSYALEW